MALVINGDGPITGVSNVTFTGAGTISGLASAAIPASKIGTGAVLQVVSNFFTTTSSTTSRTFADISGFSVSITPTSLSSKILILGQLSAAPNTTSTNYEWGMRITRNGTAIGYNPINSTYGAMSSPSAGGGEGGYTTSWSYVDSPSTTSALTYQVQFICGEGVTYYINQNYAQTYTASYHVTGGSSLIVMEIA